MSSQTLTDSDLLYLSKKYVKEVYDLLSYSHESYSHMSDSELQHSISSLEKAIYFLKVIENLRNTEKTEE